MARPAPIHAMFRVILLFVLKHSPSSNLRRMAASRLDPLQNRSNVDSKDTLLGCIVRVLQRKRKRQGPERLIRCPRS